MIAHGDGLAERSGPALPAGHPAGHRRGGSGRAGAGEIRGRAGARRLGGDADHHHHRRVDFPARAGDGGLGQEFSRAQALHRRHADRDRGRHHPAAKPVGARVTLAIVLALSWFFGRTLLGKAMLATSHNRLAAQLVGINVRLVLFLSFGLSAALGRWRAY